MAVRRKHIRLLAEQLLDKYGVNGDQAVPVERIAAGMGVTIRFQEAGDDLSGFLFRDRATGKCIVGINARHSANRQRFTIAHELGHLLLHEGESVHVDRSGYGLRFRREPDNPEDDSQEDETEANIFAAELLMPKRFIERDMCEFAAEDLLEDKVEETLVLLAKRYMVSTQALTFRLANLRYIQL